MKALKPFLLLVVLMAPLPSQAIGPDHQLVRCFFSGEELSFTFSESYNMGVVVRPVPGRARSVSVNKERVKFKYRNGTVRLNRKTFKAVILNSGGRTMISGSCKKPERLIDEEVH